MSVVRVSLSKLRDQALNVGRPTADTSSSEPCTQLIVNIHICSEPCTQLIVNIHKLHPFTEGQHCSKCEIHITRYSPPTVVQTSVWSGQCVWGNRKEEINKHSSDLTQCQQ